MASAASQRHPAPGWAGLFPETVRWRVMDPANADPAALFQVEQAQIARAVAHRQREYAAVRQLARRILADFGVGSVAIPNGRDRAPRFPSGVVGSFSHSQTLALAALARSSDVVALGCDVEPRLPLPEGVAERTLSTSERARLAGQPQWLDRLMFSAKEAAYKAQYRLSGAFLDFDAMVVNIDTCDARFTAELRIDAGPFRTGHRFAGRFELSDGLIITAVTITPDSF